MKYIIALHALILSLFTSFVKSAILDKQIYNYFNNEITKQFGKDWASYKASYGADIETTMKETFGDQDMNLIIDDFPDAPYRLVDGLLVSEENISVLFRNLTLRNLPKIQVPFVNLSLENNLLQVKTGVQRMYIDAFYFRLLNDSHHDVVPNYNFSLYEQQYTSPFVRHEVPTYGKVAITADCILQGNILATLSGRSVNLGANDLSVSECSFEVEIYKDNSEAPTTISKYFVHDTGSELKALISHALSERFLPRLQSIVYSILNTTTVFGSNLSKYRKPQIAINTEVKASNSRIIAVLNMLTASQEYNESTINLDPLEIVWLSQYGNYNMSFHDVQLSGLDTAYSSHTGGVIQIEKGGVIDEIKFHLLQLIAQFTYDSLLQNKDLGHSIEVLDIVCEIIDLGAHIRHDIGETEPIVHVGTWRALSYGVKTTGPSTPNSQHIPHSFVHAFVLKRVREAIAQHIMKYYMHAAHESYKLKDPTKLSKKINRLEPEQSDEGAKYRSKNVDYDD